MRHPVTKVFALSFFKDFFMVEIEHSSSMAKTPHVNITIKSAFSGDSTGSKLLAIKYVDSLEAFKVRLGHHLFTYMKKVFRFGIFQPSYS